MSVSKAREPLRIRKFTPIDRLFPIYEVVVGERIILDVTRADSGEFEVCISASSDGLIVPLEELEKCITAARTRLQSDTPD